MMPGWIWLVIWGVLGLGACLTLGILYARTRKPAKRLADDLAILQQDLNLVKASLAERKDA